MSPDTFTEENLLRHFASRKRNEIHDPLLCRAAVLIPLVGSGNDLSVLFTRRTEDVEHHKGQISFPGGMADEDDTSLIETALRETEEEIGIPPKLIRVMGLCDDFSTPTGFNIAPVVGCIPKLPPLRIQTGEVAEVLTVPMAFFLDPANFQQRTEFLGGKAREVIHYFYGQYDIWGATAAMLTRFISSL